MPDASRDLVAEPEVLPVEAAITPAVSRLRRLYQARYTDGFRQIVLGLLIWVAYLGITHGVGVNVGEADRRGHALLSGERALHIDVELAANRWLVHEPVLGWLAAWEYATTYILTTFAVLGWLWWRRPRRYLWARNTLVTSTVLALFSFWRWPTAPPRLLSNGSFADIVAHFHPILSWGGGAVASSADQYAAMPSLHVGWAVWVTVVSLRSGATRLGYSLASLHLLVTVGVVVATGNHYLFDVAAGAAIVGIAAAVERVRVAGVRAWRSRRQDRLAAADEFFVQVETATVQQPVGGFVLLDLTEAGAPVDVESFRQVVRSRIDGMPRFGQRLVGDGRWRHLRWQNVPVDLDSHIQEHRLPDGGGRPALLEFVARLAEQQLDRDKPMWQLWYVPNVEPGLGSAIAVMHHAVADGLGVVDILRQMFEPRLPAPDLSGVSMPSPLARAGLAVLGIGQLALDGGADRLPFTRPLSGRRSYSAALTPLEPVLELARRTGTRATDVLLAATGHALAELECAELPARRGRGARLRAVVPVTTRLPAPPGTGRPAEPGNLTSALRLDVPLQAMDPLQRLLRTNQLAEGRRRSARPFGAAAVVRWIGLLPPVLHRLACRGVYRGRHFTAIVSNMPGPSVPLSLAGAPIRDVYPIIPLAEEVPLGVGSLGWNGQFCVSVTADAGCLPQAGSLAGRIVTAIELMQQAAGLPVQPRVAEPVGAGPLAAEAVGIRSLGSGALGGPAAQAETVQAEP